MNLTHLALHIPDILLPAPQVDLSRWSVVACDQYTAEPEYWRQVAQYCQNQPSALHLIFPEVYLEDDSDSKKQRIQSINSKMQQYLQDGTLQAMPKPGFVLVDRKTSQTPSRKGLVVAIDLDAYDYTKGSQTLIRATEGTIVDRLPPRIQVRKNAALEIPHIMVLIDDPKHTVIEPLFSAPLEKLYDFDLMQNSGHLTGYAVDDPHLLQQIADNLGQLADPAYFNQHYQTENQKPLLYAMGDGNHSLATAKAIWQNLKENGAENEHPARYALVELVNLHDEGLQFEPIHRAIFHIDTQALLQAMPAFFAQQGSHLHYQRFDTEQALDAHIQTLNTQEEQQIIRFIDQQSYGLLILTHPQSPLALANLQAFLDEYLPATDAKLDYIHGDEVVTKLAHKENTLGFFLPPIDKYCLFKTIITDGALPRKTFSMGEADEKRFYLEARKITL